MRAPRRVAETPTGMPSRSLNAAMDLRARRTLGCWPVIVSISVVASSIEPDSPVPMFTVTLSRRGTAIGVV